MSFILYHCNWHIFNMYITFSGECSVWRQCATKSKIKNYVHPLWGWQRNLSSHDYFQHHKIKQEPTEHGKLNLAINDQGWEGDSNSHYIRLMNTYKWCSSFCIISICIITIYILYLTHLQLIQFALFQFVYFNLHSAWISIIIILCMKTVKDYWHIQGVGQSYNLSVNMKERNLL